MSDTEETTIDITAMKVKAAKRSVVCWKRPGGRLRRKTIANIIDITGAAKKKNIAIALPTATVSNGKGFVHRDIKSPMNGHTDNANAALAYLL